MDRYWLLHREIAEAIEHARKTVVPSAEQKEAFAAVEAEYAAAMARVRVALQEGTPEALAGAAPRNLKIAGDIAEIFVEGVLTQKPDFWTWLVYGSQTTYESIQSALALAEADPAVKKVAFFVDSPGGEVKGLFETLDAIEATKKPRPVVRSPYACSAAYAIAAVAAGNGGKIEATSKASPFGSIGVAVTYTRWADMQVIDITSTEAPDKRPDPTTEQGQKTIRKHLDDIHGVFVDYIARGRGTDADTVNADFGRGGVFLATEARKRRMIDRIGPAAVRAVAVTPDPSGSDNGGSGPDGSGSAAPAAVAASQPRPPKGVADKAQPKSDASAALGGASTKGKIMNEDEMKAQLSAQYEKGRAEGHKAGKEEGEAAERKRVKAHLKLGKACGDLDIAVKHIESGASSLDEEIAAEYQAAAMTRRDQQNRQDDSDAAGEAVDGRKPKAPEGKSDKEQLADALDKLREGAAQ